ncbi:MAG: hypothetical protein WA156_13225 [Methylocystis silviterrae]
MATKTEGERALADLEAGKFSFPMVDESMQSRGVCHADMRVA